MSCDFDLPEHYAVLDRLRLPPPPNFRKSWRVDVVQIRPGAGDRIFNFLGVGIGPNNPALGCFALYRDDIVRTASDTAEWCRNAWPLLRRPCGPHRWRLVGSEPSQWATRLMQFDLVSQRRLPWSQVGWFVRLDDGRHTFRRSAWFVAGAEIPPAWLRVQQFCHQLAADALRAVPLRD